MNEKTKINSFIKIKKGTKKIVSHAIKLLRFVSNYKRSQFIYRLIRYNKKKTKTLSLREEIKLYTNLTPFFSSIRHYGILFFCCFLHFPSSSSIFFIFFYHLTSTTSVFYVQLKVIYPELLYIILSILLWFDSNTPSHQKLCIFGVPANRIFLERFIQKRKLA